MGRKLVIFGTQNFSDMAYYLFKHDSAYDVVAFSVDGAYLRETEKFGLPIVALEELHLHFPPAECDVFVAVGIKDLNSQRDQKCADVETRGYQLASFVSSKAIIANDFKVQKNSMIMESVIIHPYVTIGPKTIVWSGSSIAMKNVIEESCWITKATFGEAGRLGRNTFVGLEATIAPLVSIGAYSLLGARSIVLKNVGDYTVFGAGKSKPSRIKSNKVSHTIQ